MATAPPLHYDRLVEASGMLGESHRWMIDRVPDGSRVLDVGCAGGYVARVLTAKGCIVDGVDLDEEAAKAARAVCRCVHVGSLDDEHFLASLAGRYDRILLGDVLEHLRDPVRVVEHLAGLLDGGGRLLISLPNVANWRIRAHLLRGRFEYVDAGLMDRTHLRFYTYLNAARELVGDAPLVVREREFTVRHIHHRLARLERWAADRWPNLLAYQTLLALEIRSR